MKILAFEREKPGVQEEDYTPHLAAEAARVWELYQSGVFRELYFRQDQPTAVLVLECADVAEADSVLSTLPLVKAGLIAFDIIPLKPYPGFSRLFTQTTNEYLQANQKRWDQLVIEHESSAFYDLEGFRNGGDRLHSIELYELGDVRGKSLLHLQCHFGMDTLAWARKGAIVTGVDFSQNAITLARSLSDELNIPADFYCSDIYNLPNVLSKEFDIVFTSYGVLHGLPDLKRWAEIIAGFLKPGGIFYIVEDHPFFRVFRAKPEGNFMAERSYFFSEHPQRIDAAGSYATDGKGVTGVSYVWDHSLGEVINSLIEAGLMIEFLHEFPFAARAKFPFMEEGVDGWWRLPAQQHGTIPFLFSLQAKKPA
jgi:SAM-dependent methyltransferase